MDKLYYWKSPYGKNFGDYLNEILFERIFNHSFEYCGNIMNADYCGIGSILESLFWCDVSSFRNRMKLYYQRFEKITSSKKPIIILGSGFGRYHNNITFRRLPRFLLLRGKYTYNNIKENGKEVEFIDGGGDGDLGILSSYLLNNDTPNKKYSLGIIPHYNDLLSPLFFELYKKHPHSIIINVREPVLDVIKTISECECILSSSLHGLIVADSLHIPNLWVENVYKTKYTEDRFKYKDYYSAFDLENDPVPIFDTLHFEIKDIFDRYKMNTERIEEKKQELLALCNNYFKRST